MPLQETSGAASYDAFGGGVPVIPYYIEEVFQTQLWTGTGYGQTVNNGIDLSGKGGMVWMKARVASGFGTPYDSNIIEDTNRGAGPYLQSNSSAAEGGVGSTAWMASFNSNGYSFGDNMDVTSKTYVGWTFRQQPKFFDVVTYTGTGSNTTISHSLGSVPACIMVKRTDTTGAWQVYHRSLANTEYLVLNTTAATATGATRWNSTTPTSTVFSIGTDATVNASGGTYVAYIFAHDAGGFGLTGTDNVISCGSFTTNGSGVGTVTLGYEPQWVLWKRSSGVGDWFLVDNMRGMPTTGVNSVSALRPNLSDAELTGADYTQATATGFVANSSGSSDFIYIAIRRGPMAVPTTGASVFVPYAYTGNGSANRDYSAIGIVTDMNWTSCRSNDVGVSPLASTRLQGNTTRLQMGAVDPEATGTYGLTWSAYQNGVQGNSVYAPGDAWNSNAYTYIGWNFKRAPKFFDEVCYTGTGSATTVTHNLGAAPELMIVKGRSGTTAWQIYSSGLANTEYLVLNTTAAKATGTTRWNSTTPTSSVFSIGTASEVNTSAATYVAYLFATCAGVSKVGSYTGNGTTQTIDCGLTAGARFVLIKRTDSTGDWYIYDTARGMTTLTDPYLRTNSTAAETATLGSVTTVSTGFALNSTILAAINVSSGTYIFLAIA